MMTLQAPSKNTFSKLVLRSALLVAIALNLAACGSGDSGQENTILPDTSASDRESGIVYKGPPPVDADVSAFKANIWDNLATEERCGQCHIAGGVSPEFVRTDDINLAYAAASRLIDLTAPSLSRMVEKVGGGHSCWRDDPQVCASIITNYIEAWATVTGTESDKIVLVAPQTLHDVTDSRSFPGDSDAFASTVHPLLTEYCSNCHSEDSALQQQPYIASADPDVAYDASKSKINLDDAAGSRLVTRLRSEFHNCWDGSCATSASEMEAAINQLINAIPITEVDPSLVVSRALSLPEGIVASNGGRMKANAIALYEFQSDSLEKAYDTSGVEPALDLNLIGNVERVGGWGIRINDGKAQGSTSASAKLHKLITATGEYSLEAWVVPDNVTQDGPARIVSYSGGPEIRNFTLGQTLYNYNYLNRSTKADGNGMPMLSTPDADEVLQATLQHVVVNFSAISGTSIYLNGEKIVENADMAGASLNDWDNTFALVLGREVDDDDMWQGVIRYLAIHKLTLTEAEIQKNFEVGVGEKFYLLFSVDQHVDLPDSYIVFQVQQFDSYSYLFNSPFFISLSDQAPEAPFEIDGMRIGINGREVPIGQAFANIKMPISSANYDAENGVPLSTLGAIIPLDKGADSDQFFLSFDRIGSASYNRVESNPPAPGVAADLGEQSDIGLRTFAEIHATLAQATGVTLATMPSAVAAVYEIVKQQLPTVENIDGFVAAHQAGVMQLAVSHCTALVDDSSRRATLFPGFDFGAEISVDNVDLLTNPLLTGLAAQELSFDDPDTGATTKSLDTQPMPDDVRALIYDLVMDMDGAGTRNTAIAVCASTLGSAVMIIQ
nr:LamG domain-containing protein [Teredinibacter waterburyi]